MRITMCDAVTDMDYDKDHTFDDFDQELETNYFVVVRDFNLSNFSANVIYDMQVLELVPYVAQQTMDFLSDYWTNMRQKEENVDLTRDTCQPFQLVVSRKKKSKKHQSDASKSFKVDASSRSPH